MAKPGNIYDIANRHRRELLLREREAATEMVRRYGELWQRLQDNLAVLTKRIAERRSAGHAVTLAWLFQDERYHALLAQIELELTNFVSFAERSIISEQAVAVAAAKQHVEQLVMAELAATGIESSWTSLPVAELENLVGFLKPGSPLHDLLAKLPKGAGETVKKELIVAVATGAGPRATAGRIRRAMAGNLTRALVVSRTETLRAYREATRQNYLANRDTVSGWVWVSAKSARTCPACLAMDGTKHRADERLDDHPNGRCVMVPLVRGAELPERETGADWLARQDESVQRQVLRGGYEAYSEGRLELADFVGRKRNARWGTMRYTRGVREAMRR